MMSETISDKIENGQWITGDEVLFECPDGVQRLFVCGKGDYNQTCGGWEHTETGQIFAINNYGHSNANGCDFVALESVYITLDNLESHSDDDSQESITMTASEVIKHPFSEQMEWYFNNKDVDKTKLVPIRFNWTGSVPSSYWLQCGPQKGVRVAEPLPACIPRGFYDYIDTKIYLGEDKNFITYSEEKTVPHSLLLESLTIQDVVASSVGGL
tara:strand:- start:2611 stop:3249 length:639 start_codon:yes stop_codon:yes gene_type:complete